MPIYTRSGDRGETSLPGGTQIAKDVPLLEAIGTIDELNSALGLVRAEALPADIDRLLRQLQNQLYSMTCQLAAAGQRQGKSTPPETARVRQLEEAIDRFESQLPTLREFILPAGTRAAAGLHVARAVCRRAERRLVSLMQEAEPARITPFLGYLNRLGDLLFVLARAANAAAGRTEVRWQDMP